MHKRVRKRIFYITLDGALDNAVKNAPHITSESTY